MSDDRNATVFKNVTSAVTSGSGILGKSAIVVAVLMIAICMAPFHLHSDAAVIGVIAIGAAIFFCWFIPIIIFAHNHPAEALLDGTLWTEHQKFMLISGSKEHPNGFSEAESRALVVGARPSESTTPEGDQK